MFDAMKLRDWTDMKLEKACITSLFGESCMLVLAEVSHSVTSNVTFGTFAATFTFSNGCTQVKS